MTVCAATPDSVNLSLGDVWTVGVSAQDPDGNSVYVTPVITVTDPTGTVSTPAVIYNGDVTYYSVVLTAVAGRHVARAVVAGYGAADFTAWVSAIVTASGMPTLVDLVGDRTTTYGYLGATSWTNAEVTDALTAEASNQRARCDIPADYPPDLAQALKRRVARNLAMRVLPLAVLRGDSDGGDSTLLPSRDPEVRRLEGPYPKLTVG